MSRLYENLKQIQEDHSARQASRESTISSGRSAEVKQVSQSSSKKKSTESSLFHSNPDENFRLWMQNCFPDASLSREEAIRQWLAKSPELRRQVLARGHAEGKQSNGSEISAAAPREAANGVRPSPASTESVRQPSEWKPQLIHGGVGSSKSDRSRKLLKLLFRFATYAALALVIGRLLWAIPTSKILSAAGSTIAGTQTRAAGSEAAPSEPAPQNPERMQTGLDSTTAPGLIDVISVGCADAQPCVEISTHGKEIVPMLSMLEDPDRAVIDFRDTTYSSDGRYIAVGRGTIQDVRIGSDEGAQPPTTRVVIDLTTKCDYELQALTDRFVLKLTPKATLPQPK